jgi:hypothetical protein
VGPSHLLGYSFRHSSCRAPELLRGLPVVLLGEVLLDKEDLAILQELPAELFVVGRLYGVARLPI